MLLVTNNEKVRESSDLCAPSSTWRADIMDVLIHVRDLVHQGHKLLTHPLAGSVKPMRPPSAQLRWTKRPGHWIWSHWN